MSLMESQEPPLPVRTRTRLQTVLDIEMDPEQAIAFLDILHHYERCDGSDPEPVLVLNRLRLALRETLGL